MGLTPRRVAFVFGWLVVGGEETEVLHLARHLDPRRYRIEVIACLRKPGMPDQTERLLEALRVPVDRTPYALSFDDTVRYLAGRLPAFDIVVACQAVPDVVPALELAESRGVRVPPLIEHGGLVVEAERASPRAARYVGVSDSIRAAAARRLLGREQDALEIPSMVDVAEFEPSRREAVRRELGLAEDAVVFGWVGRLDRKKRVEDFVRAAAIERDRDRRATFLVIGGPDAFMPEYADELRDLSAELGLGDAIRFLGDRDDVPRLLASLDVFVWLARDEGMPHVIAEAGAARLPVIATRDNGTLEQIEDGRSGVFVPHEDPAAVAAAMERLASDRALRERLGRALRARVERDYATDVVVPRWEALFDEVMGEAADAAPYATSPRPRSPGSRVATPSTSFRG
jgi:glycosyltransferase involved in cell wall biosynthesis